MHAPRLDRCAYGTATVGATLVVFSFVSLYNEASSPVHIAVRDWAQFGSTTAQTFGFVVAQGAVGTLVTQGLPVVTNGPMLAGSIYSGQAAALPAFNFAAAAGAAGPFWPHDYPALVLTPGFSITAYRTASNNGLQFGFWWELLWPNQKINPWIGDPSIDP